MNSPNEAWRGMERHGGMGRCCVCWAGLMVGSDDCQGHYPR